MEEYTLEEALQEMQDSITIYLEKKADGSYVMPVERQRPFYLLSPPGIGKTEGVRSLAARMGLGFFGTSLTHQTRQSMVGLPTITGQDSGQPKTRYTMPDLVAVLGEIATSGKKEGILLLDEFPSMPESLLAPVLALTQQKRIGDYTLPAGWILVLCGNPPEYNGTARVFDAAIMDRVRLLRIRYQMEDFLSYGRKNGIHPAILDFVRTNPSYGYLCQTAADGSQEIVTARAWEDLSYALKGFEEKGKPFDERLIRQFLQSDVVASSFFHYYSLMATVIAPQQLEEVLEGQHIAETAQKLRTFSYDQQWRALMVLEGLLGSACRNYSENIRITDKLTVLQNRIRAVRKQDDTNYYSELCSFLGNGQAGNGGSNPFVLPSGMNSRGKNLFGTKEDRQDTFYVKSMQQLQHGIEQRARKQMEENDNGLQDTAFLLSVISKKDLLETIGSLIRRYTGEILKEQTACGQRRTNVLTFVSAVADGGQLLQAFLHSYNQQSDFMRMESYHPTAIYTKLAAQMYKDA